MANLAIKGHPTRGNEVIEILEMLGGTNGENYWGVFDNRFYLINSLGDIDDRSLIDKSNYQLYTLEEFLEKFPYKVRDKVQYKRATSCGTVYEIEQLKWEDNQVKYIICDLYWKNCKCTVTSEDLQPYKEETMEVSEEFFNKYCANCGSQRCTAEGEWLKECKHYKEETMNRKYNVEEYLKVWEETENGLEVVVNDNFELKEDNGKFYIIKKQPQYPKTYEECMKIINATEEKMRFGYKSYLLSKFEQLLICRDAYWKIAGDWKPDFTNKDEKKFTISFIEDEIYFSGTYVRNSLLVFPTIEMRDAFYENFRDLIEICKELL